MKRIRTILILPVLPVVLAGCKTSSGGTEPASAINKSDELVSGYYDVVKDWPKPLSSWPGHKGWTWGSVQCVFAQNPNRIFISQRGELRDIRTPLAPQQTYAVPGVEGTVHLSAPLAQVFPRNASVDTMGSPGEGPSGKGVEGVDYRWEHILVVVDADGNLVEAWTQWDKLFKRVHKVRISPYDPEKRVWVFDDRANTIYVFSNDGKQLLQTIGAAAKRPEDDPHFGRQTDIAWLPDGTFFVSDGYENTRVVKFDKNGKVLKEWGHKGIGGGDPTLLNPLREKRPGYFNTVHSIAVDQLRRVYVADRANGRIQIFDENGNFLDQWDLGNISMTYDLFMTADQHLWMADGHANYKIYKYDLTGRMLYSFGSWGIYPGQIWGVHQMSVDQEGNLYVAEVNAGRAQKFRPKKGADPQYLVGQPVRAAWKE